MTYCHEKLIKNMKFEKLEVSDPKLIDAVARSCGEVTVGCADVGGLVEEVMATASEMRERREALQDVIASLADDQKRVTDSTDEARLLSSRAKEDLHNSTDVIRMSMKEFGDLTDLVVALAEHITGFAGAMDQVRRVSQNIDNIANTTSILALNAAIEAHRAGAAGATFAVVAAEVKQLAFSTREATDEISATVNSLGREAESLVEKIEKGVSKGNDAQRNFQKIDDTVNRISDLVSQVDDQNSDIAQNTGLIHNKVQQVQEVLDHFSQSADKNKSTLEAAKTKVNDLETTSKVMFGQLVESGFATEDRKFVDLAISGRDEMVEIVEKALADGDLTKEALFDRQYVEIADSNPTRYDNKFNAFADAHIRPLLDKYLSMDAVIACVTSNIDGYLPTHVSERSLEPNGDPEHDDKYCRNRRKLLDDLTKRAIEEKDRPYSVSVYRYVKTKDGKSAAGKQVFVPLYFDGEYWGNFEILYRN